MTTLYCERRGAGPPLVLLHGWGMNAAVWGPFADDLATDHELYLVELPGHGRSPWCSGTTLQQWADACLAVAPPLAAWVGWSLGVMVALQATLTAPRRVRGLIMAAGTPKYLASPDWPHAMQAATFENFRQLLSDDPRGTLARFLALQVQGDSAARATLKRLREALHAVPETHPEALAAGLELLQTVDLRDRLPIIDVPLLWLLGAKDSLAPAAIAPQLQALLPVVAHLEILPDCGHAPFLSHSADMLARVRPFLRSHHV